MGETRHLDLKVPRGWGQCTTRELEMIAEEMIRSQMMASLSRFHPFDWTEIKTRLFFRFAQIEIVSQYVYDGDETDARYGNTTFVCRHRSPGNLSPGDRLVEFELQTWQVHSFLEQLKWIDGADEKGRPLPMPKLMWPYPTRISRWTFKWGNLAFLGPNPLLWPVIMADSSEWCPLEKEHFAPGELMDGMTWQTYRWINDWMEAYTNTANALVAERDKHRPKVGKRSLFGRICGRFGIKLGAGTSVSSIAELAKQEQDIRLTVLSLVFGCPKWRIKMARISEVEWQVVMFWWSSMMQYLKEQYPKCFKSSDKRPRSRSKQQPLPIELYTRSMATLQKYLGGLTEAEINGQTAHAILRHLNDMAVEAEEMEKIRRKHK